MSAPLSIALIFLWWTKSLVKRRCTSHSNTCSFSDNLKAQLCQNVQKISFLQTIFSKVSPPFCYFWKTRQKCPLNKLLRRRFGKKISKNPQKLPEKHPQSSQFKERKVVFYKRLNLGGLDCSLDTNFGVSSHFFVTKGVSFLSEKLCS